MQIEPEQPEDPKQASADASPVPQQESTFSGQDKGTSDESDKKASKSTAKSIFLAVFIGLAINILIGLLVDINQLFEAFKQTSLFTIVMPFTLVVAVYLIDTCRFIMVFRKFGIHLSFRDGLYNNVIGHFFSDITPGSVGGQPFQVVHFSKLGLDSTTSSNVVFSRLIESNLVQLLIVIVFFNRGIGMISTIGKGSWLLSAGMLGTVLLTVVLLLAFLNPHLLGVLALKIEKVWLGKLIAKISKKPDWAERLSVWSQGLGEGFKVLWRHNTGTMVVDIVLFMIDQLLWSFALYIPLGVLTGSSVPFPEFLLSFTLCSLISLVIPTPGASGSVEASYLLVLGSLTGKPAATMSAILIWRFGTYYLHLLLGGLIYFLVSVKKDSYARMPDGSIRRIKTRKSRQS